MKVLGVTKSPLTVNLDPYAIFAGQMLGPLSGEPDGQLRARPALQEYYESLDRYAESDDHPTSDIDGDNDLEEDSE